MTKLCFDLCTFSEPSHINKYFVHLKTHLRNKETIKCPFADCSFQSSVLSTFTAHRSRYHRFSTLNNFKPELFVQRVLTNAGLEEPSCDPVPGAEAEPHLENDEAVKRQLAFLFLHMQTILHISNYAVQEVIDELFDIGYFAY